MSECTSNFCGLKTSRTSHRIDSKSSRQRQWLPTPYHAWGSSDRGSSTVEYLIPRSSWPDSLTERRLGFAGSRKERRKMGE